jgi:predicted nuclease of predicted toxin-antitoxin system
LSGIGFTRVVLDQGVPRDAAVLLRDRNFECTHVGEVGMSRATDQQILAWSLAQEAIVVTLDADFHAILAVSGSTGPSVIRVRMQGLDAFAVAAIIEKALADYARDLASGSLVTVKRNKSTCHKLPIGGL